MIMYQPDQRCEIIPTFSMTSNLLFGLLELHNDFYIIGCTVKHGEVNTLTCIINPCL